VGQRLKCLAELTYAEGLGSLVKRPAATALDATCDAERESVSPASMPLRGAGGVSTYQGMFGPAVMRLG
jgi:hypothetical protein